MSLILCWFNSGHNSIKAKWRYSFDSMALMKIVGPGRPLALWKPTSVSCLRNPVNANLHQQPNVCCMFIKADIKTYKNSSLGSTAHLFIQSVTSLLNVSFVTSCSWLVRSHDSMRIQLSIFSLAEMDHLEEVTEIYSALIISLLWIFLIMNK